MKFTSDPVQRRQITKLMDAYVSAGSVIIQAQERLAEAQIRQEALRRRAEDEASSLVVPDMRMSAASIAALAADPAAMISEDELAATAAAQDKARSATKAQRARVAAIEAAIAQVDQEAAEAEAELVMHQRVEISARGDLVTAVHAALICEFKARWSVLAAEVIDPMIAIGFDSDLLSKDGLDTDSLVRLHTWQRWDEADPDKGGRNVSETLLLLDSYRMSERRASAAVMVDELLAAIPTSEKKAGIRGTLTRSRDRIHAAWLASLDRSAKKEPTSQPTISF